MSDEPLPRPSASPSEAKPDEPRRFESPGGTVAGETVRYEPPMRLEAGQLVLGRYVLVSALGQSGLTAVWRARDRMLGETVAVKFLPEAVTRDPVAMEKLREEARRARQLTQPHIVRTHDLVQDATLAAVTMEYVEGSSLARLRLAQAGRVFSAETLAPFVAQLCAALEYAHGSARLVHGDLKPANLMVTRDGQLKVTDFGVARGVMDAYRRVAGGAAGHAAGVLMYASPQQLTGEPPTAADDIYAVGATLYELLTGKPPFFRGSADSLSAQIRERVPPSVTERRAELAVAGEVVPRAWEQTIQACLAKQPGDRPRSARDLAKRLGFAEAAPIETPPSTPDSDQRESVLESYPLSGRRSAAPWGWTDYVLVGALLLGSAAYVAGFTPLPRPWRADSALGRRVSRLFTNERARLELRARPDTTVTGINPQGKEIEMGIVGQDGKATLSRQLAAGRYTLRLKHRDCADIELPNVELNGDSTTALAPAQQPLPGELRVFSVPSGAEVWLNGVRVGKTPATLRGQPSERPLQLEVGARGYRKAGQALTLRPNEVRVVNLGTLEATSGGIELRNIPVGLAMATARVMVDGLEMRPQRAGGVWRFEGLEAGARKLEIVSPDYAPWKETVTVEDRATAIVDVRLQRIPVRR